MSRTPEQELLRANQAFYDAFRGGDMDGMDELWAHHTPVACLHPGWPPLHGRSEVMSSWRELLVGGQNPDLRFEQAQAVLLGAAGFVTCLEVLPVGTLAATNVFVLEEGIWQIVHHQAGPLGSAPDEASRLN